MTTTQFTSLSKVHVCLVLVPKDELAFRLIIDLSFLIASMFTPTPETLLFLGRAFRSPSTLDVGQD